MSSCVEFNSSKTQLLFSLFFYHPRMSKEMPFHRKSSQSFGLVILLQTKSLIHTFKMTSINCCLFSSFFSFFQSAGLLVFSPSIISLGEDPLLALSIDLMEFGRYESVLNTTSTTSDPLLVISKNLRRFA